MSVNPGFCGEFLMDYGMANGGCLFMDACCVSKTRHEDGRNSMEESSIINNSLLVLEREVAGYFIVPDGGLTP